MHSNNQADSSSPIFSIYQQQIFRQSRPDLSVMLQHQHQHHQQEQQHQQHVEWREKIAPLMPPYPVPSVDFKLGLSDDNGGANLCYASSDVQNHMVHHILPQDYIPKLKEQPFWRTNNQDSLANSKIPGSDGENFARSKGPEFGELEAIYNLARIGDMGQTRSSSALTGENSSPAAVAGPGLEQCSEASEAEKRRNKKRKKKRLEEELSSMAMFFEALMKQVMDHQDLLHMKFLEVLERLDRERMEREEGWRRKEAEKDKREAVERERERASALRREAMIVAYIEKMTGKRLNYPNANAEYVERAEQQ